MAASKKIDHADIRQTFNELDLDKNGMLDLEEFEEAMKILGLNSSEVDKAFSVTYLDRKNKSEKIITLRLCQESSEGTKLVALCQSSWLLFFLFEKKLGRYGSKRAGIKIAANLAFAFFFFFPLPHKKMINSVVSTLGLFFLFLSQVGKN